MSFLQGLDTGLAVFLTKFLENEGGLANAGLGGLVVYLVNVLCNSSNLLFHFGDNSFHDVGFKWLIIKMICVIIIVSVAKIQGLVTPEGELSLC